MLECEVEDHELIEQWLTARKGHRVYLRVPKIGEKEKLVELAKKNAALVLSQDRERIKREEGRTIGAMKEIADILGMQGIQRIEAFDISEYQRFRIRRLHGRLRHGQAQTPATTANLKSAPSKAPMTTPVCAKS